jgi:uncharacterized membrane protein YhhN
MNLGRRVRDIALEVLIAMILVGAFVAYILSAPKGSKVDFRPIGVLVNAIVVFGFLISWFRWTRRNVRFWAILTIFLLAHIVVYIILFRHVQELPTSNYAIFSLLELGLFSFVLTKLLAP